MTSRAINVLTPSDVAASATVAVTADPDAPVVFTTIDGAGGLEFLAVDPEDAESTAAALSLDETVDVAAVETDVVATIESASSDPLRASQWAFDE